MTTADRLHFWSTAIQSLRLWVMRLVAWLAAVSGSREMRLMAREDLRQVRSELRFLLVTRVALDLEAGAFAPPMHRNSRNRPDIHQALSRRRFMRHALRGIVIRTLHDARRMLDRIGTYVARVAKNLRTCVAERGVIGCADGLAPLRDMAARIGAPDT